MKQAPLGLLLAALLSVPARTEGGSASLDDAAVAALQKRWPQALGLVEKRLDDLPEMFVRDRAAALAALRGAADYAEAVDLPEAGRAEAQATAARAVRAGMDALGPQSGLFLGSDGGLGVIAREVLGDAAVRDALAKNGGAKAAEEGRLDLRAQSLYGEGRYAEAAEAAQAAQKIGPADPDASALLALIRNRAAAPRAIGAAMAAAPDGAATRSGTTQASAAPASFRLAASAPPPPGSAGPLNPKSADYWDRQLLASLLARSDANPVAREYLSPLLRASKVTIRLDREKSNPDIRGSWGYYDLRTSVIHYNLDLINKDIIQYDAYYARREPSRVLGPISPSRPLDAAQIDFVTGRFLPLAVHEAGGHGTNSDDLKRALGANRAPINKDTEVMAWRLEAAAIDAERRRDPRYLTEPTQWDREENSWVSAWEDGRRLDQAGAVVRYLDAMPGYRHLVLVGGDAETTRRRYAASVSLVQTSCRARYDAACGVAISRLAALAPASGQAALEDARRRLDQNPGDDALRAEVLDQLGQLAVVDDRLDPKGIAVVAAYYRGQENRVQASEALADPLTIWQKWADAWHE